VQCVASFAWASFEEIQALKHISAEEMAVLQTLEPVFTTLLAFVFLKDNITPNTVVGAMFIISATCMGSKAK
jgi:drug/metabolite transporter (DMT)-like permease